MATPTVEDYGPFQVTFFNNGDSDSATGLTGAQNWTSIEMSDVQTSIQAWSGMITNAPARKVDLSMFWGNLGSGVLGQTQNLTNGDGTHAWSNVEHVWRDGANESNSGYDSFMDFSTTAAGGSWNFGSGTPSSSQTDFESVIAHELGHALGIWDSYFAALGEWGDTSMGFRGLSRWDNYLVDPTGNHPAASSAGTPGTFDVRGNPIYFDGPHAEAAYGGPVPIYAPIGYDPGSSLCHPDIPTDLMYWEMPDGAVRRQPSGLDWAFMQDLGWSVDPVPEPSSLLALAAGALGVIGISLRRRNA
jgi:hypothetical protein